MTGVPYVSQAPPSAAARERVHTSGRLVSRGVVIGYLSLVVLIPLAAVVWRSAGEGAGVFWTAVTTPQALAALRLTLLSSLVVVVVNAVMGTLLAWVLVRDDFRGKAIANGIIDLPFALPTVVVGLTLLALYGPQGPIGINVAYTRVGLLLALLFVTLPFVVRAVQPVLLELDRELEEAAATLGSTSWSTFRRIILPSLLPAMLGGVSLAFARALGEFGAVVLISGNIPFQTQVASVQIFGQVESDNLTGAAAVSVVLLAFSLLTLLAIGSVQHWSARHAD